MQTNRVEKELSATRGLRGHSSFSASSGDTIAYELLGEGDTKVVFYHGFPAGRKQGEVFKRYCREFDLQVLIFDRPGYGDSRAKRYTKGYLPLAKTIEELTTSIGWKRFHLISVSGGTPYALALASSSRRVISLNTVCGLGPLSEASFRDEFSERYLKMMQMAERTPLIILNGILAAARNGRAPQTFSGFQVGSLLRHLSARRSLQQGLGGAKLDLSNYLRARDINWEQIRCPTTIWHGTRDSVVPCEFASLLKARIPHARLELKGGESHFSLAQNHAPEILKALAVHDG